MKGFPQIDRFFTAVCSMLILSVFILFLFSCEKESLQDDSLRLRAEKFDSASLRTMLSYEGCGANCIEENSETYFVKSDKKSVSFGNRNNTKSVEYIAYNTEDKFTVEVYFIASNPNAGVDITIKIKDKTNQFLGIKSGNTGITKSFSIDLPIGSWNACEMIDFSILQEEFGADIEFVESYSLIGVCSSNCEESFSYEDKQDGSYTFTYVSPEDLEGAEVKFICPHIVSFVAEDEKEYSVNPGNSHGSPTVLKWTGDIEACSEITFTLSFEADCEQTNSGKANIFTDFKVNGNSKKGDNENIVFACSE